MSARDERLLRLLIKVYPRAFRDRFGEELLESLRRDRQRPRFRGPLGACSFWRHVLVDSLRSSREVRRGERRPLRKEITMPRLTADLRFVARTARRNLRVTLPAALSLALGIGASTAILTVTKGVLVDPLPYPDSDRLALVWSEMPASGFQRYPISGPGLDDLRHRSTQLEELASIWTTTGALVENDEPESLRLGLMTWNFPSLLGAAPVLGRAFEPGDEGTGAGTVLISEALWRRRFGESLRSWVGGYASTAGGAFEAGPMSSSAFFPRASVSFCRRTPGWRRTSTYGSPSAPTSGRGLDRSIT